MMQTSGRSNDIKNKISEVYDKLKTGNAGQSRYLIEYLKKEARDIPEMSDFDLLLLQKEFSKK